MRLYDSRSRPPRTRRLVPHAGFVGSGAPWAGKIIPGEPQHGRQHEREQEHARERTTRNHHFQCTAAKYQGRAARTAALGPGYVLIFDHVYRHDRVRA